MLYHIHWHFSLTPKERPTEVWVFIEPARILWGRCLALSWIRLFKLLDWDYRARHAPPCKRAGEIHAPKFREAGRAGGPDRMMMGGAYVLTSLFPL